MTSAAATPAQYLKELPADRARYVTRLWEIVAANLPKGFEQTMTYGMPGFVVPHSTYPGGYYVDPKQPLPFLSIASQKNYVSLYHYGLYADPVLLKWFTAEYPKHSSARLDMGKSCIRFKKPEQIPYELIGELAKKMTVKDWIALYEKTVKK